MTFKRKKAQVAFVFRYFKEHSFGTDGKGNYLCHVTETTTSYDHGLDFCEAFHKEFPGYRRDPNFINTSARLSRLMKHLSDEGAVIRWRLSNEKNVRNDPIWQWCYKLPQDIINELKTEKETPETMAERFV